MLPNAMLTEEKKAHLKQLGYSDTQIATIETNLTKAKETAEASGRASKEATPVAEGGQSVTTESPATTTEPEAVSKEATPGLTAQEVAEAVGAVMTPLLGRLEFLETTLGVLAKEITAVRDSQDTVANQAIAATPAMSLKELMAQSVFGNGVAVIDGRSALAKDKPKETTPVAPAVTGVEFLDRLVQLNQQAVAQ